MWVPISCINCTDCGCLCVCMFASAPTVARPSPGSTHGALCASLPAQHFPVEMTGRSSPVSLGPCVTSLVLSASSFFASHLSPSHVQGALTAPTFLRASLSASFDQAPLGYLPPCPLPRPGKPGGKDMQGDLIWAPPPQESLCQPHHILEEEGAPGRGLPYIAAVVHALLEQS